MAMELRIQVAFCHPQITLVSRRGSSFPASGGHLPLIKGLDDPHPFCTFAAFHAFLVLFLSLLRFQSRVLRSGISRINSSSSSLEMTLRMTIFSLSTGVNTFPRFSRYHGLQNIIQFVLRPPSIFSVVISVTSQIPVRP